MTGGEIKSKVNVMIVSDMGLPERCVVLKLQGAMANNDLCVYFIHTVAVKKKILSAFLFYIYNDKLIGEQCCF